MANYRYRVEWEEVPPILYGKHRKPQKGAFRFVCPDDGDSVLHEAQQILMAICKERGMTTVKHSIEKLERVL